MIGESIAIRAVRKNIAKMASADLPVLIGGETGTGKELVARMLHQRSSRADGPFIAVNCPALPHELFQAEVFGYEKGAFTGADRQNPGRIDAAQGGTLFLDEIGDLAPSTQAVLLRFLQEGIYERLGSAKSIRADVRVLAATHTDLVKAVERGLFREDLYYRLSTLTVKVPPLKARGHDILLIAEHFVGTLAKELGLRPHKLTPDARQRLTEHAWPGNVRELRNRILQAMVLSDGPEIDGKTLGLTATEPTPATHQATLKECRRAAEREALWNSLRDTNGCIDTAARTLAISRAQFYRLLKVHDLDPTACGGCDQASPDPPSSHRK